MPPRHVRYQAALRPERQASYQNGVKMLVFSMKSKVRLYFELMRFHRPIGTYLLLWPTLWAVWLAANGHPSLKMVIIFVLGTVVMRAAGCIVNDLLDHKFDAHVERTRLRPLASGALSKREALILFCVLCLIGLLIVLQLNLYCLILAIIAALLILIYPFSASLPSSSATASPIAHRLSSRPSHRPRAVHGHADPILQGWGSGRARTRVRFSLSPSRPSPPFLLLRSSCCRRDGGRRRRRRLGITEAQGSSRGRQGWVSRLPTPV